MTDADALLAANATFYSTFSRGDVAGMESVWAEAATITCLHPGWDALVGREAVIGSWRAILRSGAPPIRASHARAIVYGKTGVVLCREHLGAATLAATNWFVIEDGRWRMICHQAAPIARTMAAEGSAEDADEPDDVDADGEDDDDDTGPVNGNDGGAGGMVN